MYRRLLFGIAVLSLLLLFAPLRSSAQGYSYYDVEQVITLQPASGTAGTDVGYSTTSPNVYCLIEKDGINGTVFVRYEWNVSFGSPTYCIVGTTDNVQGIATKYANGSPAASSTCRDAVGGYASNGVTYQSNPSHYSTNGGVARPLSPLASSYLIEIDCLAQANDDEGYSTATGSITVIAP